MPLADDAVRSQPDAKESAVAPSAAGRITELRVSANLMALETGVFCVFPAPGSPSPDLATGLPGVRITRCPGAAGRPDAVSISTFRDDGWLDNTAALVRVTDGPAQVLVTIYQAAGQPGENAPRLQVLRLAGDPAVAGSDPAASASPGPEPDVMAHIQGSGDVPGKFGEWIGKRGSRRWIEGFGVSDKGPIGPGALEYQGVLGRGWLSPWVDNGKFCGSRGMALPLLGLNVRLKGAAAKEFTMRYSATFIDGSAVGPVEAGLACEAPGLAAMEAFQIELVPKTEHSGTPKSTAPRVPAPKSPARAGRR
jgi:Clostridial hydrophobic W